jgi:uncharacterized protein involved in exopolysaccharide biosynthesis
VDLRELRAVVSRHLVVAIAALCACILVGAFAAFVPDKVYATTATLAYSIDENVDSSGGATQLAAFLIPVVEESARSRSLRERAAGDVPEQYRSIRVDLTASSSQNIIRIKGESTSRFAAQAWVNAVANRLIEAQERAYWDPDDETLAALRAAGDELEDRLEGIPMPEIAAE